MIIVDSALAERVREDNPVRVGVVGAGFSGSRIVHQIVTAVPGLRVVAVANRTQAHAEAAYRLAGVERTRRPSSAVLARVTTRSPKIRTYCGTVRMSMS